MVLAGFSLQSAIDQQRTTRHLTMSPSTLPGNTSPSIRVQASRGLPCVGGECILSRPINLPQKEHETDERDTCTYRFAYHCRAAPNSWSNDQTFRPSSRLSAGVQKLGTQWRDRDACAVSRFVAMIDKAAVVRFFPHRKLWAGGVPSFHDLGVHPPVGTEPLEQIEDQWLKRRHDCFLQ